MGANTHLVPTSEFSKAVNTSLTILVDRTSKGGWKGLTVTPSPGQNQALNDLARRPLETPVDRRSNAASCDLLSTTELQKTWISELGNQIDSGIALGC